MSRRLTVLHCVAAGPRVGFGHLTRAGALARALHARPYLALRGGSAAARTAAAGGWTLLPATPDSLAALAPDLVVVDDPSRQAAARWIRAARTRDIPVVLVRDLGLNDLAADLTIDASLPGAAPGTSADLRGPAFAILDPAIAELRRRPGTRDRRRVVIALGGGAHVRTHGARLAAALREMAPDLRVDLAPGFDGGPLPALPSGCRWLAPDALRPALAGAGLAVVSAGVTLLEACALGTPLVVIGLTRAQRLTAASIAGRGAAIDASRASVRQALGRAASAAAALAVMPRVAARIAAEARRLVDGQGARRVAVRLHTLADRAGKGTRHAA